jgi:hypothetical protein
LAGRRLHFRLEFAGKLLTNSQKSDIIIGQFA